MSATERMKAAKCSNYVSVTQSSSVHSRGLLLIEVLWKDGTGYCAGAVYGAEEDKSVRGMTDLQTRLSGTHTQTHPHIPHTYPTHTPPTHTHTHTK